MTVKLVPDYCKNVDEIVELVEANEDSFFIRQPGEEFNFVTAYGESKLKSMFRWNMPKELKELIKESIPEEDRTCDSFCINKYNPGDYLKRHKDSAGGYWKFKLIFLRSDAPHFCWYDEQGKGNLVDESPGMLIDMPVNLEHEVTEIKQNERPKISLALSWGRTR
jgi:hypothetical protein|tara:strand:+ start:2861 stop:3355 length:495 start_codon:yes stop_codon:yes gene_type:complete